MFHQSYNPFGRIDLPFPMPKEVSPRGRRKSLAKRLEEQDRRLKQLSFEGLPLAMQRLHQSKEEDDVANNSLTEDDVANNSLSSCPPPTLSASHDDGVLLACPDSPMTHPPRTVIVRTGDPHDVPTPRTKNSRHRKRFFSLDFSTICTEREETSLGAEEELSLSEEEDQSAASFDHNEDDCGEDGDNDNADDEWESSTTFTLSTYPPRSITLVQNHLDAMATPHRNRMYRSCSDLSSNCSSDGKFSSLPPKQVFPSLPKLAEQLVIQEEYESLHKPEVTAETEEDDDQIPHAMSWVYREETDEDEEQNIPHVMSCPEKIFGDSEDDEDDIFDLPYAETHAMPVRSIDIVSCPGRMLTDSSIDDSIDL
eukprot:scaffold4074_cov149-Skeletonema_menzelii.AAC.4